MLSLHYVLFVDQTKPMASVYARTAQPDQWLNTDYHSPEETVRLGKLVLPISDIYRKVTFS
ncbi:hypothetical protein GCM10023187_34770 [Nibrella viscosa]|uniref:Uncharacterized protein n=1 Tax=Nibrella viscosa TaxID=1084524 RepID=A0ABP8KMF3_9BACT